MAINKAWLRDQKTYIDRLRTGEETRPYTYTTGSNEVKKCLVLLLCKYKMEYTIKSRGGGVSMITTDTKCCPFCKKER